MEPRSRIKVALVGSGSVASALASAISEQPALELTTVCSRSAVHAHRLADPLGASAIDDMALLPPDTDMAIVAVTDNALPQVAQSVPPQCRSALWVHTSGATPPSVFSGAADCYGVLYPLQTFTRGVSVDMAKVPFFVEGCDAVTTTRILEFASLLSPDVRVADTRQRTLLHVAAVFACNFTNHMLTLADDLLSDNGLPLDVLRPLVEETMRKAFANHPYQGQTGPAVRGDTLTMERHLSLMPEQLKELYTTLSLSIAERHHHNPSPS